MKVEGEFLNEYRREIDSRRPASEEDLIVTVKQMAESRRKKKKKTMKGIIFGTVASLIAFMILQ